jgi:hypothetical protein
MVGGLQIPVRFAEQGRRAGKSFEKWPEGWQLPAVGILERLFEPGLQSIHVYSTARLC